MRTQKMVTFFIVMLMLGLLPVNSYSRVIVDIGESREDPLLVALQKYEPKFWAPWMADFVAALNREGTVTLITVLAQDSSGKPDIQFDRGGNLLTRDRYGKKLIESRKVPAGRLKQDLGIVLAGQHVAELNQETRKELNVALYGPGYEKGPRNDADNNRGTQRFKDAVLELDEYRNAKKIERLQAKARQTDKNDSVVSAATSRVQNSGGGQLTTVSQGRPSETRPNKSSTRPAVTTSVKQRTIAAYQAVYSVPIPEGQSNSQEMLLIQKRVRALDLEGVDTDLITYFKLLDEKFTIEIKVYQEYEGGEADYRQAVAEEEYYEQRWSAAHQSGDTPPDWGSLARMAKEFREFKNRMEALLNRIDSKYDPQMIAALRRLETKYGATFHMSPSK